MINIKISVFFNKFIKAIKFGQPAIFLFGSCSLRSQQLVLTIGLIISKTKLKKGEFTVDLSK